MKQTMPEKLRLIADCIEHGKGVEFLSGGGEWLIKYLSPLDEKTITISRSVLYRAKPDKPRSVYIESTPSG